MPRDERPTVYSTEHGDQRKQPQKAAARLVSLAPNQQTAYLHRDSKGRGGKSVTLVKNLQLTGQDLAALLKTLKQACGTGGTLRGEVIEIQGEQREKIAALLRGLGYRVKIAGG